MFYPSAIWRPGPVSKQGYAGHAVNQTKGVVCHSMVGTFAGAMIELDKLDRRASWHFSVLKTGQVYQHYDTRAVTWHCGSLEWNEKLIGIEHEGGFNPTTEPLTEVQRDASVALVRWLSAECGFPMERNVALWEHNEVAPPSDATSCPSHRIPWEYYTTPAPVEEEDMPKVVHNTTDGKIYLVGFKAPIWLTDTNEVAQLEKAYGAQVAVSDATMKQMVL